MVRPVIRPSAFHSNTEVNFEGTHEHDLFNDMRERMLENWHRFNHKAVGGDCTLLFS